MEIEITNPWQPVLIPSLIAISIFCTLMITSVVINVGNYFRIINHRKTIDVDDQQLFNVFINAKTLWQIFAINLIFCLPAIIVSLNLWFKFDQFDQPLWQGWSGFIMALIAIIVIISLLISCFWLISALSRHLIFETDWNVQNWAQRWWKKQLIKTAHQQNYHQYFATYLAYLVANSANWNDFWNLLMLTSLYDANPMTKIFHLQWNQHRFQSDHQDYQPLIQTLMVAKLARKLDIHHPQLQTHHYQYGKVVNFYLNNQAQLRPIFNHLFNTINLDQKSDQYFPIQNTQKQFLTNANKWYNKQANIDQTTYCLISYFNHQIHPLIVYQQLAMQFPYCNYFKQLKTWIATQFENHYQLTINQKGFLTTVTIKFEPYWYQFQFHYHWVDDQQFRTQFKIQTPFVITVGFSHFLDQIKQWLTQNYHQVQAWKINNYSLDDLKTQFQNRFKHQFKHLFINHIFPQVHPLVINRIKIQFCFTNHYQINYQLQHQSWNNDVNFRQLLVNINLKMHTLLSPQLWNQTINDLVNQIHNQYESYRDFKIWLDQVDQDEQLQQLGLLN